MPESSWSYTKERFRRSGGLTIGEDAGVAVVSALIGWGILDRESAAENAVGAMVIGLGGAVAWQLVRLVVRFVWTVPKEMHVEALRQVKEIEAQRHELGESIREMETQAAERPPVTRAEWMEMAREFRALPDSSVRADYDSKREVRHRWHVSGQFAVPQVEVLCKRAGTMLLASPNLIKCLTYDVWAEEDPMSRWLEYLRKQRAFSTNRFHHRETATGVRLLDQVSCIEELPAASARACIECSSAEM